MSSQNKSKVSARKMFRVLETENKKLQRHNETVVSNLMDLLREKYLIPYCDKTKYEFCAGNGTWAFYKADGHSVDFDFLNLRLNGLYPTRADQEIIDLLDFQFEHETCCLGSQMASYNPNVKDKTL